MLVHVFHNRKIKGNFWIETKIFHLGYIMSYSNWGYDYEIETWGLKVKVSSKNQEMRSRPENTDMANGIMDGN
jgi:hypothetical protein